jgi:transposase
MKLTKKQILKIPHLKKIGYNDSKIAEMFNVHPRTIADWKKKLRAAGHEVVNSVPGRKTLEL